MGFSSSIVKQGNLTKRMEREKERGKQQVSKLCEFPRDKGFRRIKRRMLDEGRKSMANSLLEDSNFSPTSIISTIKRDKIVFTTRQLGHRAIDFGESNRAIEK